MGRTKWTGVLGVVLLATLFPPAQAAAEDIPFVEPITESHTPDLGTRGTGPTELAKPSPFAPAESTQGTEPTSVVVEFADGVATPAAVGGQPTEAITGTPLAVIAIGADEDAQAVADELETRPDIAAAAPDQTLTAFEIPNDPKYPDQAAAFERIGVPRAWERATGSSDVVVAVIDSGIDLDHPDFAGRLVAGFDFVDDDTVPADVAGHGTIVAGIIAGIRDNGTAVAGVAGGGTRVMPIRVLDANGDGSAADIAAAIRFATDNGADVINLSLGGSGFNSVLDSAVAYATDRNVVVIAAAGNDAQRNVNTPASAPGAIGVSATDNNGDTAFFTTFGPHVDLAAPGVSITSTANGPGAATTSDSGTSFSAPMVSGAAALLFARHPNWTADRVLTELLLKAEDRGPVGLDEYYGYGLLDVSAALGVTGKAPYVGVTTAATDNEPNDTYDLATAASVGVNAGSIDVEGDVDWWSFDSGAEARLTVTVQGSVPDLDGPEFDPILELHRPTGELVASADETALGQPESVSFNAIAGVHRLSVSNFHGTVSPGGYQLTITSTPITGTAWQPPSYVVSGPRTVLYTESIGAGSIQTKSWIPTADDDVVSADDSAIATLIADGQPTVILRIAVPAANRPLSEGEYLGLGTQFHSTSDEGTVGIIEVSENCIDAWAVFDDVTRAPSEEITGFTVRYEIRCAGAERHRGFFRWNSEDIPSSPGPPLTFPGGATPDADRAALATDGPWVRSTTPTIRATGVSRTANLTLTSGRDLDPTTVNGGTVALLDSVYGFQYPASVSFNATSDTITVNPQFTLEPNTPYLLIVAGVEDLAGENLPVTYVPFSTSGSFPKPSIGGVYTPVVGDFTGEGATDIIWYAPGSAPDYLHIGSWYGLLDAGPFPVNGTYEPFTLDLNGDGYDDIIWYGPGASRPDYIWYGGPDGFDSTPTSAIGVYQPFTLDQNGDGYDDIIWYAPGTRPDYIWYGTPTGHSSVPTTILGSYQPFTGDFNDDGFDDIFWYAPGTAKDYIWFGSPTGHTSVQTSVSGSYRPVAGDFNADGYGDVVFYAPGSAPDYEWLFGPNGHTSRRITVTNTYEPLGGDFNGDNHDDIVWYGVGSRPDTISLGGPNGLGL